MYGKIIFIFISLFIFSSCCTTRSISAPEIDRNLTELQNRIVELQTRNTELEKEIDRLTSENRFYADYYKQTITGIGTNIHSAIESTDNLDKHLDKLYRDHYELERILWELTNQNNPIRVTNSNTN